MGAAGVRPETGGVIFAKRPPLDQGFASALDENRDRLVAQTALVDLKLFDGGKLAVDPGGDHRGHVAAPFGWRCGDVMSGCPAPCGPLAPLR